MHSTLLPNEKDVHKKNSEISYPWMPVTETITNGFFTIDDHWMVTYWNKAAEELLGVRAKNIVGKAYARACGNSLGRFGKTCAATKRNHLFLPVDSLRD